MMFCFLHFFSLNLKLSCKSNYFLSSFQLSFCRSHQSHCVSECLKSFTNRFFFNFIFLFSFCCLQHRLLFVRSHRQKRGTQFLSQQRYNHVVLLNYPTFANAATFCPRERLKEFNQKKPVNYTAMKFHYREALIGWLR